MTEPRARTAKARRPWWLLPIFGPMPAVDQRSLTLLGLVPLACFFENYDLSMLMSAPSYIAADFGIPETRRFDDHRRERLAAADGIGGVEGWLAPIRALASTYPVRVLAITLVGGFYSAGEIAVFQFCGYFTLTTHGWAPWQLSTMVVGAGAVGMIGNVLAGRLGDLFGRRPVGFVVATSFPALAYLFYHVPGPVLPLPRRRRCSSCRRRAGASSRRSARSTRERAASSVHREALVADGAAHARATTSVRSATSTSVRCARGNARATCCTRTPVPAPRSSTRSAASRGR